MKLRELCELCGFEYDGKNTNKALERVRKEYVVEKNMLKRGDYVVVRPLTEEEKLTRKQITQFKPILKDTLYVCLSLSKDNTIRCNADRFLERLQVVNEYYRLFVYDTYSTKKENFIKEQFNTTDNRIVAMKWSELNTFAKACDPILKRTLKDCFREMEKDQHIYIKKHPMGAIKTKVEYDNNKEYPITVKSELSNEQIETRMKLRVQKMQSINENFTNWSKVDFYTQRQIDNEVSKEMGYDYFYDEYELIINRDIVRDIVVNNERLNELRNSLNQETIKKIFSSHSNDLLDLSYAKKKQGIDALIIPNETPNE